MGYKAGEHWEVVVSTPIGYKTIERGTKQECQMAAMLYKMNCGNSPDVKVSVEKVDEYSM